MVTLKESIAAAKTQYQVYGSLAIGVIGATAMLYFSDNLPFQRFLGEVNPIMAMLAVAVLGFFLLSYFLRNAYFIIFKKQSFNKLFPFLGGAALLAGVMILVDLRVVFPADINILFPSSLLFYPAIGFLVEVLFHVLPLAVLLFLLGPVLKNAESGWFMWCCLVLVALPEPIYQVAAMAGTGNYPPWLVPYVGVHLFAFNFLQLITFRRLDFFSMYLVRVVYYLMWHIGWGEARLSLLF